MRPAVPPGGEATLVASLAELPAAARRFHEAPVCPEVRALRRRARTTLGLPHGAIMLVAGGQPGFCGGGLGTLAKLVALAHCRRVEPACRTLFYLAASDAATSNDEFHRVPVTPGPQPRKQGLNRKHLPSGVPADRVVVAPELYAAALARIAAAFGASEVPGWLRAAYLDARPQGSLAARNIAVLRELAERLGVTPDRWLVDRETETALLGPDLLARLLDGWPAAQVALNALAGGRELAAQGAGVGAGTGAGAGGGAGGGVLRPAPPEVAPFWILRPGAAGRLRARFDGRRLWLEDGAALTPDELTAALRAGALQVALRSTARVPVLGLFCDGQAVGPGSRYNDLLDAARASLPLPLPPRCRVAPADLPAGLGAATCLAEFAVADRLAALRRRLREAGARGFF